MKITVFCGSNSGKKLNFKTAIQELGQWIGQNNHQLIYGGAKTGLMGVLANSALENGAYVIGYIPEILVHREKPHQHLSELHVLKTMDERKAKLIESPDVMIVFPGGIGTMEELFDALVWKRLHHATTPIIIYNLDHFYDLLKTTLKTMCEAGLIPQEEFDHYIFASSLKDIASHLLEKKSSLH